MEQEHADRISLVLKTAADLTAENLKAEKLLVIAQVDGQFFCSGSPKSLPLIFNVAAKAAEQLVEVIDTKTNE
jgi:acetylglutamate kinase